jgi:ABC-type nitrate/sulfonate/bicarbonate transport system substrate-binding protein
MSSALWEKTVDRQRLKPVNKSVVRFRSAGQFVCCTYFSKCMNHSSSIKIFAALLIAFLLQSPVCAADKVRIGFPDLAAQFAPLPLAQKRGFFEEEGLQGEFIRMVPTVGVAALASGEIDYYTSIGVGVTAAIRGVPVKVVAGYTTSTAIALIARPEFKSVQELGGKTIGISSFGSPLEVIARLTFRHFNLDPDAIKFVALGPADARLAGMKQGLTAATLASPPTDFIAKKMGFVVLARAQDLFNYPLSGLVASARKIKERPDEVKRIIKAGIKGNRYIRQNEEGTIRIITEWLKINNEMAKATYESVLKAFTENGSVPEDGLRLLIEEAKKAAKVSREVSPADVAEFSILGEAQKELGIKRR